MKHLTTYLIVCLLIFAAVRSVAAQAVPSAKTEPYLGVFTEKLPPSLAAQLAELIPPRQGLLITRVLPTSPADRAGLEKYDILLTYNKQKLSDPADLKRRITNEKAGRAVELELVHRAKLKTIQIELSERRVPAEGGPKVAPRNVGPNQFAPRAVPNPGGIPPAVPRVADANQTELPPDRSLILSSTDGSEFALRCEVPDEERKLQSYELKGTLAEIEKKLAELPETVQGDVKQSLAALRTDANRGWTFRVQIQPQIREGYRGLRVRMIRPGDGDAVRLFELEHAFATNQPFNVEQLLSRAALKKELSQLSGIVRVKVEQTLRSVRIPNVRVDVENSQ